MESFAGMASEHYLMESFTEVLGEIKDRMEEMAANKSYLNVFEGKDIYEQHYIITPIHQIIMHLYIRHLNSKRLDEVECFDYKITTYTELYEDLVSLKSTSDPSIVECSDWDEEPECLKPPTSVILESKSDHSIKECSDWDEESFKPPTSVMFGNVDLQSDESQSDESGHSNTSGYEQENSSNNLSNNIQNVESDDSGYYDGCTSDEEKNVDRSYFDTDEYRSFVIEAKKSKLPMCQYTFIQSYADLQGAKTLFYDELYSQSVFLTSQSVEKSLKSLAHLMSQVSKCIKKHSAEDIFKDVKCRQLDESFGTYSEQLGTLCSMFESIGGKPDRNWRGANMSIRSRYFRHDAQSNYYLETNPSSVFTYKEANEAIQIAEEIFVITEYIFEEYCKNLIAN